ncbi:universal stress protein [Halobacteriales archaeon Cl-PHB]
MTDRPAVLVPIQPLEGESVPDGVPELLANAHVVLLGYHVIPEQTAPGQARMQFEERATRKLSEAQASLETAGATVDRRLVFTHEGQKSIDRQIAEHDCQAVLVPNPTGPPEDVLVTIRGEVAVERIANLTGGLFADTDVDLTLYHALDEDETDAEATQLLDGLREGLLDRGVDASAIEFRIDTEAHDLDAIVDAASEFDAVVMGETDPSLATFVFGMPSETVAERFLGPVLVVQSGGPATE